MNLTTIDRYFELYPEASSLISKPQEVAKVNRRIASVSRNVEIYLNRKIELDERIEKFTPDNGSGTKSIKLSSFPITTVSSLTVFGSEQSEGVDYSIDEDDGIIYFSYPITRDFPLFEKSISVLYTGGMADDVDEFILNYPDIEAEVLMQVNFELKRIADIAMKSVSNGNTSTQFNPYGFQDSLIAVLNRYKRIGSP